MSLLAAAPGPFLAEARLCLPELGALLPRLSQNCTAAPWNLPLSSVCWTRGGRALGVGAFLLETSPFSCVGGSWCIAMCGGRFLAHRAL